MDLRELKINKDNIGKHPWELARLHVVSSLFGTVYPQIKSLNPVVFDVGCGDIFLVKYMSKKFPQAKYYAIDTAFDDKLLEEFTEETKGTNLHVSKTFEEAGTLAGEDIAAIFLFDVVEHIENDVAFLTGLLKSPLITEQTFILITVPAYQCLFTSHDIFLGHYRRYSNSSLQKLLDSSGLKAERMGYFFLMPLVFRTLQWLSEKINPKKNIEAKGIAGWNKGRVFTQMLKTLLIIDFTISFYLQKAGIKMPGLSNYAICRKQ